MKDREDIYTAGEHYLKDRISSQDRTGSFSTSMADFAF